MLFLITLFCTGCHVKDENLGPSTAPEDEFGSYVVVDMIMLLIIVPYGNCAIGDVQ